MRSLRQRLKRSKGRGSEYQVEIERRKSDKTMHVRVTGVPSFGTSGEIIGVLTALQPIDYEVARADIAHLVATRPIIALCSTASSRLSGSLSTSIGWICRCTRRKATMPSPSAASPRRAAIIRSGGGRSHGFSESGSTGNAPVMSDILVDWKKTAEGRKALEESPGNGAADFRRRPQGAHCAPDPPREPPGRSAVVHVKEGGTFMTRAP